MSPRHIHPNISSLTMAHSHLMARLTGLEPATLGVTGQYSNQLSYNRIVAVRVGFEPTVTVGLPSAI